MISDRLKGWIHVWNTKGKGVKVFSLVGIYRKIALWSIIAL